MNECEQFTGRFRDLCEGRGREGRGDPPQAAVAAFRAQHGLGPPGTAPFSTRNGTTGPHPFAPRSVAVALICHDYGRYLGESLDSVLAQTRPADEIVVIDDNSTDETPDVAASYADRGVRYQHVTVGNVHQARRAAFEMSKSEAICFLDADDKLAPQYLELGLAQFNEPRVAVVYSDIEFFGIRTGRSVYPAYQHESLQRDNYIHAGSLVRREALEVSRPFDIEIDPLLIQGDWFLWKRVLQGAWIARKQNALYFYRQHASNWTLAMRAATPQPSYFNYAGLQHETVTLFIPLSGRRDAWPALAGFLERQTWPHDRTRLIFVDTSGDRRFQTAVREWIARCDYADVRHLVDSVEEPGLAEKDRNDKAIRDRVVKAMWRIYRHLPRVAETEYVWVLEDDIVPPDDVCHRLLHGFDVRTASVAAPYLSRYRQQFVVWDQQGQLAAAAGKGVSVVGGNGFGCVILRRSAIIEHVFTRYQDADDFDVAFYRKLAGSPLVAKVDWTCVCQHGPDQAPTIWQKMIHVGTAVVRHAADGLKKLDDAAYQQRLAVCSQCPSCDSLNWICRDKSCGCHLKIKAGWRSENCPQAKWPSEKNGEVL